MEYRNELYHYGIKGQKWGTRRWQNPDGTFNEAGKKRYFNSDGTLNKRGQKFQARSEYKQQKRKINSQRAAVNAAFDKKRTDNLYGLDSGGIGARAKAHIKNEYERSKALNKLDQKALDAKREYRQKLGKKHTDTLLMKWGQQSINEVSNQSMSEFTRDYIKSAVTQAYNTVVSKRDN